jgi:hypothetical protein
MYTLHFTNPLQTLVGSIEAVKWFYYEVIFPDKKRFQNVRIFRNGYELEVPLRDNLAEKKL